MMVMTAKFNFKKTMLILGGIAAGILAIILLFGGSSQEEEAPAAPSCAGNEGRVQFLRTMGWQVDPEPKEASQVRMPSETSPVYERYNNLQKSQGYDLTDYAGKKAMRYVYEVKNYPGSTEPVYATLLIHKDKVIGGDITDTGTAGKIRGLKRKPEKLAPAPSLPVPSETTVPTETTGEVPQ